MGYVRPETVDAALEALVGGASVIAGGTDWYPARVGRPLPGDLLDITAIDGFSGITRVAGGFEIGAATTWSEILRADLSPAFDGLKAAAREVGSVQIQNMGTVGGNLCNASPAADGVPPLLSLNASVRLVSPRGARTVPLDAFLTGVRETLRSPDELLQSIFIPDPGPRAASSFVKLGARRYLVISIAMVAAVLRVERGRVHDVRIAVGACSAVAQRLAELERQLEGARLADVAHLVTADAMTELAPISDVRGTSEYRSEAAVRLVRAALAKAIEAAKDG